MSKKYHQTNRQRRTKKRFVWTLIKWGFILGLLCFILLTFWIAALAKNLPDPQKLSERQQAQTTKIYDRTGDVLLFEIFNERKRTLVELNEIPDYAVNATLAIEDKNFYEHKGVAFKSIARAAISNVLGRKSGQGGASTLTQQLIKNAIVGDEHTIVRKIKEAILATQLEKKYSKDEILQLYFNEIPYGSTNYGIEAAAQSYFAKQVQDISLSEAATLAALPQAPTRYLNNIPRLQIRRDYILDVMVEQDKISAEEARLAKLDDIEIKQRVDNNIRAPHFVMMVKEQLSNTLGEKLVETGGLKITTSLDYDLQEIAEEEITAGVEHNREHNQAENAALVAIDVPTGEIRAMVGSRNFFDDEYDGQFNVALAPRQPGSSFKPLVYVAGFEKGYTPKTILYDVNTSFSNAIGEPYEPKNYDLKERGPVTIRQALQGSLNIPAVKMIYLAGINHVLDVAENLGYTTLSDRSRFGLSLVLGGGEVTLLEHTTGFATFAREGTYMPPVSILKVEDDDGTTLFEHEEKKGKKVIDRNAALQLSNILSDNEARTFAFGASSVLQIGERPVAAKTGTTNDYRDGWLLGYTPSFAAGVWAGNNDNTPMRKGSGGSTAAGPIWQKFMQRALAGTQIQTFPTPEQVKTDKPVLMGQDPGLQEVEIDIISGKLATEHTPEETRLTKKFFAGHSILYHIDKNDPQGKPPTNPESDAQFASWEKGIFEWAGKTDEELNKVPLEISEPPTEYDDIHKPQFTPTISILEPSKGDSVGRNFVARATASSKQGVVRVRYFVDGVAVGESTSGPEFEKNLNLGQFVSGFHTFEARAYDKDSNVGIQKFDIILTGQSDSPTIVWEYPPPNITITEIEFPFTFEFRPTMPSRINAITVKMKKGNGETEDVATYTENISGNMTYTWEKIPDEAGQYEFQFHVLYDTVKASTPPSLPIFVNK